MISSSIREGLNMLMLKVDNANGVFTSGRCVLYLSYTIIIYHMAAGVFAASLFSYEWNSTGQKN